MPPKSACWFCPFHRPSEWRRTKSEEPELFAWSVGLEELLNARRHELSRDPVYLTRFGVPLDQAFADEQLSLWEGPGDGADLDACESGCCMT